MVVYSVYILNKAGGLIYNYDHRMPSGPIEKTFSYPVHFDLKEKDGKIFVNFGERDGIKVGYVIQAINGAHVQGINTDDGRKILDVINDSSNFPLAITFSKPPLSTNEKMMLLGMFHSFFAIAVQLSPVEGSSGIESIETDGYRIHCFQTMTGIKFILLTDPKQGGCDNLMHELYKIYSDVALKNPFYSIDMPIRSQSADEQIKRAVELCEAYVNMNVT